MNNMSSDDPCPGGALTDLAKGGRSARTREEALEDLISVLEMAAVQMGWIYRPSGRNSSDLPSLAARLSAAHAAYTLASRQIRRTTVGRMLPE
ncbi:MAG: hypothetical protein JWL77_4411 [Chthonomonadaceae bacterium]|nr:hypothetical protein [Chthonomonadaceae bacterium]